MLRRINDGVPSCASRRGGISDGTSQYVVVGADAIGIDDRDKMKIKCRALVGVYDGA